MNIALIAHETRKELMSQFCIAYCGVLSQHNLFATEATAKLVYEVTGLRITKFLSETQGGSYQLAARIACSEIDVLLFFRDGNSMDPSDMNLVRICDIYNIPIATNISTAELIMLSLNKKESSRQRRGG